MLWPELGPDEAQRDFKIAMSALYSVLEPGRGRKTPSAFIERDGTLYGLRPEADLGLDAQRFEELIGAGDESLAEDPEVALRKYRQALGLYQGEYLGEFPYEEWSSEERERLLTLYLRTAERVGQMHLDQEAWQEAIEACHLILARDDCWENAYRLMMVAYDQLGNQVEVRRVYQRCIERLQAELGVEPAAATAELYNAILARS
jgi:two-component SAPR family response regulator